MFLKMYPRSYASAAFLSQGEQYLPQVALNSGPVTSNPLSRLSQLILGNQQQQGYGSLLYDSYVSLFQGAYNNLVQSGSYLFQGTPQYYLSNIRQPQLNLYRSTPVNTCNSNPQITNSFGQVFPANKNNKPTTVPVVSSSQPLSNITAKFATGKSLVKTRPCSTDSGYCSLADDKNPIPSENEKIRQVILDKINLKPDAEEIDQSNKSVVASQTEAELKEDIRGRILNEIGISVEKSPDFNRKTAYLHHCTDSDKTDNGIPGDNTSKESVAIDTPPEQQVRGKDGSFDGEIESNRQLSDDSSTVGVTQLIEMIDNQDYRRRNYNMSSRDDRGFNQRGFPGGHSKDQRGKRGSNTAPESSAAKKPCGPSWGSGAVNYTEHIPPTHSPHSQITQEIMAYYVKNHQTPELCRMKMALRDALMAIFYEAFPDCGLYIVGSSMTGFGTLTSDMDICLMVSDEMVDRREALQILYVARQVFDCCSFLHDVKLIPAKVPILRFRDRISNVECDLNINNFVGIRNTHLLRYYATVDWRLKPLMLFIKKWARFHDINDANKATLSSYSLSLMCIHYLQSECKPPVLPSLQRIQPMMFGETNDIRNLRLDQNIQFKSHNTEQLGDLFLGFLKYYGQDFRFDRDVISVRLGTRIPYHLCEMSKDRKDRAKCIKIEEPFDLTNTARSCFDANIFSRVERVFRRSYNKLAQTRNVKSLFTSPF